MKDLLPSEQISKQNQSSLINNTPDIIHASPEVQKTLSSVTFNKDLTVESEKYGFAREWHKKFPPMIVVSITNVCNQKCIHCYSKTFMNKPEYVKNMFPFPLWEKLCEEVSHWPGVIMNFGTDGEPLLHPQFLDMLRVARKNKVDPINITCNGTRITPAFTEAILNENLVDVMNVSLDAFKPETYKKIRQYDMSIILKNVHNLIERRNELKSPLKIQVNIIDQPESHDEIEDFKNYWTPKVDNVMIRTYYDATSVIGETGGNVTGRQIDFPKIERWPCQMFWRRLNLGDDGTVRYCTDDWYNKTKVGDLRHNTIQEIWTSDIYNKFRHLHQTRQFAKNPYCSKCTEWQGMTWDYDYFTAMEKMLGAKYV